MTRARKYPLSLSVPIFGEIPLHPKIIFDELKLKEGPLWAQFFKYGICGVLSTVILALVVSMFHWYAPEFMSNDLPVETKKVNLRIALFTAFVPANLFAYFTNRWLVFTPGKLSFWNEIGVFTFISAVSFIGGEIGKNVMLDLGFANWLATGAFAVSSALVNFIARKFLVFSR
ncbi:GtrA family protein [Rubritalea tangerina]|uniref:GtrA family protein n=1 Tax=Rubritalea tangerina TaxID=430798 RepID=A0ABW4Z8G2_9BACT